MPPRKIAISTGGGDAPGLNAVIRAATLAALERGWEIWGIRHGYRGLLEPTADGLVRLDRDAVRGIMHLGGTVLGTANRGNPFAYPTDVDGSLTPAAVDRSEELVFNVLVVACCHRVHVTSRSQVVSDGGHDRPLEEPRGATCRGK